MLDPFDTPRDTVAALIAAHPYFAAGVDPVTKAVPVHTEKVGDIENVLLRQLSQLGLAVAVLVPDASDGKESGVFVTQELRIVVEVSEQVLFNQAATGTKKPALVAARKVIEAIHRKPNGLDAPGQMHRPGLNEILVDLEASPMRRKHDRFLVYHVTAYTRVTYSLNP
jgi:phage-related minor tail protein